MKGVTDNEILVANSAPVSGPYIAIGDPMNAGIQGYFDMINASGGIHGRKIRFLHEDDGDDPVRARQILEQFLEQGVFAYIGHYGSGIVSATLDRLKEIGMPVVYFVTAISDLYKEHALTPADGRNCFPVQTIYVAEGAVFVARGVSDFHASSIGAIFSDDDTGRELMIGVDKQCASFSIPCWKRSVSATGDNLSEAVADVLSHDVDFVIIASSRPYFASIANELAQQGNTAPAITSYVNMIVTESIKVFKTVLGQYPLYVPSWVDYHQERSLQNLDLVSRWLGDYSIHAYAHCGWMAGYVFCEGLRRLGDKELTWENYMYAMEEKPFALPFGGILDFADGKRLGAQEMILSQLSRDVPTGWKQIDGLKSTKELLRSSALRSYGQITPLPERQQPVLTAR